MNRQRLPRQSASNSGGGTTSPSDAASPSASSGGLGVTSSGSASAGVVTSTLSSSQSTGAVESLTPSNSAATSSSPGTTSTQGSTISSRPSSSSAAGTSSPTPSSSIPPPTTTSTVPSSTSIPPSSTTPPPASPSSQQGTPTTFTSSYTTFINGTLVATQTLIPSTIPPQLAPSTSSNRAAVIGGSAAGGTAILILLLTLAFCARRKRFKQLNFLDAITLRRKQLWSRATLLDGEDLVEVDPQRSHRYTDYGSPWDTRDSTQGSQRALIAGRATPRTPGTPDTPRTPMGGPSRWSETGSVFREGVWPPPHAHEHERTRLMDADPLGARDDPDLDLSRIVDDVMGPPPTTAHYSDRSVTSMYRDSVASGPEGALRSRTVSNASNAALLEAAGLGPTLGVGPGAVTVPVRPSPLAQPTSSKSDSVNRRDGNGS